MVEIFARNNLDYNINIRARFGATVCALVRAGIGIAIIDQFTVAHDFMAGIKLLRIEEATRYETYIATKRGVSLSRHAEYFVQCLRKEMKSGGVERSNAGQIVNAKIEHNVQCDLNNSNCVILLLLDFWQSVG